MCNSTWTLTVCDGSSGAQQENMSKTWPPRISTLVSMGKPIGTQGEIFVFHFMDFWDYFGAYVCVHVQIMGAPELRREIFKTKVPDTNFQVDLYGETNRNTR